MEERVVNFFSLVHRHVLIEMQNTKADDYELLIRSCTTVKIPNPLRIRPCIAEILGSKLRSYFSVSLTEIYDHERIQAKVICFTSLHTIAVHSSGIGRIRSKTIIYFLSSRSYAAIEYRIRYGAYWVCARHARSYAKFVIVDLGWLFLSVLCMRRHLSMHQGEL